MKKLLIAILSISTSIAFADFASSLNSAASNPNTAKCINTCDAGLLLKALGKDKSTTGDAVKTACQVACADKCFSEKIANGEKSDAAAVDCKDSLNKTFSGK
jgi:tellurite resistance protein